MGGRRRSGRRGAATGGRERCGGGPRAPCDRPAGRRRARADRRPPARRQRPSRVGSALARRASPSGRPAAQLRGGLQWRSCPPSGGRCRPGGGHDGDAVRRPRYMVGHATPAAAAADRDRDGGGRDRSGHLLLPGAPRAAASARGSRGRGLPARARRRRRVRERPAAERRTGSNSEHFQVPRRTTTPPTAVRGSSYRVDGRRLAAVPRTSVFATGQLGPGSHQVVVRASNSAGGRCAGSAGGSCRCPAPVVMPGRRAGRRRTSTAPAIRCGGTGRSAG